MADRFSEKIKNLEAKLFKLKTVGLKSSSSLSTTSKQVAIPNGKRLADIVVNTESIALIAAYIVSPTTLDKNKGLVLRFGTNQNHESIVSLGVLSGYNLDGIIVKIISTSSFTYRLEFP